MAGVPAHHLEVGHAGARVFRCNVLPTETFQMPPHGFQKGFGFVFARVANDHRFATAQVQVGQGGFVGHAAGKPQHIAQGFFVRGIGKHPAAAQGRAAGGVMNGNNGFQAGFRITEKRQMFVVVELGMTEYVRGSVAAGHGEILPHRAGSRHERVSCSCRPACGRRSDFGVRFSIGGFPPEGALLGLDENKTSGVLR